MLLMVIFSPSIFAQGLVFDTSNEKEFGESLERIKKGLNKQDLKKFEENFRVIIRFYDLKERALCRKNPKREPNLLGQIILDAFKGKTAKQVINGMDKQIKQMKAENIIENKKSNLWVDALKKAMMADDLKYNEIAFMN